MNKLKEYGQNYINLLAQIGSSNEGEVISILDPNCNKIVNGITCYKTSNAIRDQLFEARELAGSWVIVTNNIITDDEANNCIIEYDLTSEKFGRFVVKSILKFNTAGLITEINESF